MYQTFLTIIVEMIKLLPPGTTEFSGMGGELCCHLIVLPGSEIKALGGEGVVRQRSRGQASHFQHLAGDMLV